MTKEAVDARPSFFQRASAESWLYDIQVSGRGASLESSSRQMCLSAVRTPVLKIVVKALKMTLLPRGVESCARACVYAVK